MKCSNSTVNAQGWRAIEVRALKKYVPIMQALKKKKNKGVEIG
jgi:hypothetical protein